MWMERMYFGTDHMIGQDEDEFEDTVAEVIEFIRTEAAR